MLLFNLDLLGRDPAQFLLLMAATALALVLAITVHEASHALLATWQGDPTARSLGRLSLNPLRHLDKMGTIAMLLVGFGWGKPVPVRPGWFRSGPKAGSAIVAFAGPAANLVAAAAFAVPVRLGLLAGALPLGAGGIEGAIAGFVGQVIWLIIAYNIVLAVFNLIPLAPLDGFSVLLGLLPPEPARSFARLEAYGPGILMLILMMGYMPGVDFGVWDLLGPVVQGVSNLMLGRSVL